MAPNHATEASSAAPESPALLTVAQAAARLSISRTAVYELCNSHQLEHFCLSANNKGYRIAESEIVAFLERRRQKRLYVPEEPEIISRRRRANGLPHGLSCLPLPKALRA